MIDSNRLAAIVNDHPTRFSQAAGRHPRGLEHFSSLILPTRACRRTQRLRDFLLGGRDNNFKIMVEVNNIIRSAEPQFACLHLIGIHHAHAKRRAGRGGRRACHAAILRGQAHGGSGADGDGAKASGVRRIVAGWRTRQTSCRPIVRAASRRSRRAGRPASMKPRAAKLHIKEEATYRHQWAAW